MTYHQIAEFDYHLRRRNPRLADEATPELAKALGCEDKLDKIFEDSADRTAERNVANLAVPIVPGFLNLLHVLRLAGGAEAGDFAFDFLLFVGAGVGERGPSDIAGNRGPTKKAFEALANLLPRRGGLCRCRRGFVVSLWLLPVVITTCPYSQDTCPATRLAGADADA